jgi:Lrp/AsnC family transcriptional regulator, leucine-responsive regulatory protein
MEDIDRKICRILQSDARTSSTDIAAAVGLSVSATNERVRKLFSSGTITAARAVVDGRQVAAGTCAYMIVDMQYEGEEEATAALVARPEVQEIHHVSGQHSYFVKLRIADTHALQKFLQTHVKPLKAIKRTETIFVLETLKETTEVHIAESDGG